MTFTPSRRFKRDYALLIRRDSAVANLILLLAEVTDDNGRVHLGPFPEEEIRRLMVARFIDPRAYQLTGGPE